MVRQGQSLFILNLVSPRHNEDVSWIHLEEEEHTRNLAYTKMLPKGAVEMGRLQPSVEFPYKGNDTLDVEPICSKKICVKGKS